MLFWNDSHSLGWNISHSIVSYNRLLYISYYSRFIRLPIAGDPKKYQEGLSMIVSFDQMLEKAKQGEPMVLAGAGAQDVDTIKAMAAAEEAGMIRPVLVGDIPTI